MNKKLRDFQRSKVYAAEIKCFGPPVEALTLENCKKFLSDLTAKMNLREVNLKDGRRCRHPSSVFATRTITLPKFSRREWVICHELAHLETSCEYAPHGPEYCANYIKIVSVALGVDFAIALLKSFEEDGIVIEETEEIKNIRNMKVVC